MYVVSCVTEYLTLLSHMRRVLTESHFYLVSKLEAEKYYTLNSPLKILDNQNIFLVNI